VILQLWLQLGATAAIILVASHFLAKSADTISDKTGLGRTFIGVVLLATATSLPEFGTGLSSILIVDAPDLAVGDAFGSNLFNLMIIGLLDLYWRNGPLLNAVGSTAVLVGALSLALVAFATIAALVHGSTTFISGWPLSPFSAIVMFLFVGAMVLIYWDGRRQVEGDGPPPDTDRYAGASLGRAVFAYAVSSIVVVASAVWLAKTGDRLAEEMGWEASLMGTLFLAFSTSLPELATSFAAVKLNAPDLAVSNLLGSNLFNMGFVLFLDDVAYVDGVLWTGISQVHVLTGAIAVLMTAIVIIALLTRPHPRLGKYWTLEGAALVALYVTAAVLVFKLA